MKHSDLATLAIGRVLQMGLMFLTLKMLTHFLSSQELGIYFLILSLVGFFGLVAVNPIGSYFNRELHGWAKHERLKHALLWFSGFAFVATICAIGILALLTMLPVTTWSLSIGIAPLCLSAGAMILGTTLNNTFIPALNFLGRRKLFVALTVFSQATCLGVSIVAIQVTHSRTAALWLGVTGLLQALFGWLACSILIRTCSKEPTNIPFHRELYRKAKRFGAPLILANVGVWGLTQGYRPLFELRHGLDMLAMVGLGIGIAASLAGAVETVAQQLFLPAFYENSHSDAAIKRTQNWLHIWWALFPVYLGVAVSTALFANSLIAIFANSKFLEASHFLALGAVAELFRMSGNVIGLFHHSERTTGKTILPYLVGAAATAILTLTLRADKLGWALIIGQLFALLFLIAHVYRDIFFSISRVTALWVSLFAATPVIIKFVVSVLFHSELIALGATGISLTTLVFLFWSQLKMSAVDG